MGPHDKRMPKTSSSWGQLNQKMLPWPCCGPPSLQSSYFVAIFGAGPWVSLSMVEQFHYCIGSSFRMQITVSRTGTGIGDYSLECLCTLNASKYAELFMSGIFHQPGTDPFLLEEMFLEGTCAMIQGPRARIPTLLFWDVDQDHGKHASWHIDFIFHHLYISCYHWLISDYVIVSAAWMRKDLFKALVYQWC